MPTHVHVYLPQGFARTLRLNCAPALSDLAYRILEPLCRRDVDPTVDAVAEHYDISRSRAAAALRSLERNGLLRRWRRSYGRGYWTHFYVITDEPYAWLDDAQLQGKITHIEDQAAAHAQQVSDYPVRPSFPVPAVTADMAAPVTPAAPTTPVAGTAGSSGRDAVAETGADRSHATSRADNSDASNQAITNKFSYGGELPPLAPSGQTIHSRNKDRQSRPRNAGGRTYADRIAHVLASIPPESLQWVPAAVRLTTDLLHSPLARAQWLPVLAAALASGRTEQHLHRYLAEDYETARSVPACLRSRLNRLRDELAYERSIVARPDSALDAAPIG
jgi:predicted transcriptional regulator